MVYFWMQDLASMEDVLALARDLDDEEQTYFRLVCQIAYPADVVDEKILPMIGRLK